MTFISIIIANYNYERFLREAIDSALNQTYPNVEVIVVDDGSTDNSRKIIDSYFKRIIPVMKENGGHSSACNSGFALSQGDIICFLDSDDIFALNKVEQIVELFDKNPLASWAFHELEYIDIYGCLLALKQDSSEFSEVTFLDLRQEFSSKIFPYGPPPTPCLCFRRSLLEKIMPIPAAMGIAGDGFLKFGAMKLSPGLHSPAKLTFQRIHGANAGTKQDNENLKGNYGLKTAFYLREKFSETKHFTDKLFAGSFARLVGVLGLKKALEIYECRQYIKRYISLATWLMYGSRIFFIYLRTVWNRRGIQS